MHQFLIQVFDETGVDAFLFEDDNMFAEDDFDRDKKGEGCLVYNKNEWKN